MPLAALVLAFVNMSDEVNFPRAASRSSHASSSKEKSYSESQSHGKREYDEKELKSSSRAQKEANLFQSGARMEVDEGKKSKKSKSKKEKKNGDEEEGAKVDELRMTAAEAAALKGIAVEAPLYISLLRYTGIECGMQMLGAVREVHELHALIALPNGLKGKLNLTEYSDSLTEHLQKTLENANDSDNEDGSGSSSRMQVSSSSSASSFPSSMTQVLSVGQIIRVCSLTTHELASTSKQLELSTRESKLNDQRTESSHSPTTIGTTIATSIKSVEDHGYIISTGLPNISGFLPFANVPKETGKLTPGLRFDLPVQAIQGKVYTFAYNPKQAHKIITSEQVVTVDSLHPGMLVKATVSKVLNDGLWLTFLDYFSGSVDIHHVAHADADAPLVFGSRSELDEWFKQGETLKARILHIHPETKRVALSLLPNIISLTLADFGKVAVGDRFEEGEIRRVDEKGGLAMIVPVKSESGSDITYRGYVPIAKVSDAKKERVTESHYEIGTAKKVRVFGFNLLEGTLLLSHRKSDWKDPYLSYADVKVGEVVQGTIKSVNSKGAVVTLSSNVEAFCPRSHLSDIDINDPESRFKPGSEIKARVLRVSAAEHSAIVTFKKTLVKSTLDIVTDYKPAQGIWTHGSILSVQPTGLLVALYNDVKGFIPLHELNNQVDTNESPDAIVKTLRSIFKIGQVVKCRVVEANPTTQRMTLSFSSTPSATQTEKDGIRTFITKFKPGTTLKNLTVAKRDATGLVLNHVVEAEGITVPVLIPLYHLSDHKELAKTKLESFKVGQVVESLYIIAKRRSLLVATLKASLLESKEAKKLPFSYDQLKEGGVYHGYIARTFEGGILVRFGDEFVGFAPKGNLASNHHISNLQGEFYEDQSVVAQVVSTDAAKQQVTLSLKSDVCRTKDASYLYSYLLDLQSVTKKKRDVEWPKFVVGGVVKAKVKQCESWGVSMEVGNLSCFVHPSQTDGGSSSYTVGSTYPVVILDINYQKGILDVSLRSEFVKKVESGKAKKPLASSSSPMDATIELVKRDYLVLSVQGKDGISIVMAPSRDFNNEGYLDPFQSYKPLSTVSVAIDPKPFNGMQLALLRGSESDASADPSKRKKDVFQSASIKTLADVQVGKVIEGMVLQIHPHRVEFALGGRVRGYLDISAVDDIALPKKNCDLSHLLSSLSSSSSESSESAKKKTKKSSGSRESSSTTSALATELENLKLPSSHPFSKFKVGQLVKDLKVHSFTEARSDGTITEGLTSIPKSGGEDEAHQSKYHINLTQRHLSEPPTFSQLSIGSIVPLWISQITSSSLNGYVGRNVRAYCSALESSHSTSIASSLSAHFKPGQVVLAAVVDLEKEKAKVHVSIRALHIESGLASSPSTMKVGDVTMVRVIAFKMPYLRVQAFDKTYGRVPVTELSDVYEEKPLDTWTAKEGLFMDAKLVSLDSHPSSSSSSSSSSPSEKDVHPTFSLRKSMVSPTSGRSSKSSSQVLNPRISSYEDVAPGVKLSGYISRHYPDKHFCFVQLGEGVVGHLPYSVIGDKFVKDPEKKFPVGSLVYGTVLKVDVEHKRVDFAMRERGTASEQEEVGTKYEDLKVGEVVKGVVSNIQAFGVFIRINHSKISALCHVSLLKDSENSNKSRHGRRHQQSSKEGGDGSSMPPQDRMTLEDIQSMFKVGDKVTAVVAKKEDDKKKLTLSMRASDLLKAKKSKKNKDAEEDNEKETKMEAESEEESSSTSSSSSSSSSSTSSGSASGESDDGEVISKALQKSSAKKRKATSDAVLSSESDSEHDERSSSSKMHVDNDNSKQKKAKKAKREDVDSDDDEVHVSLHPKNRHDDSEDNSDEDGSDDVDESSGDDGSDDDAESSSGSEDDYEGSGAGLSSTVHWDDLKFKGDDKKASGGKKSSVSWSMDVDDDVSPGDAESEDDDSSSKKKKEKSNGKPKTTREEIDEEQKVAAKERALLGDNKLEKDADFERALVSSPNSSYVWAKWIAQKVHEGDMQKARATAEKALKRIDDREDDERFNIWVVYLNLENQYGTRESFSILVRRAAQSSKPKPIYAEAIKMLLKSDHRKEAEDIYQLILRKYKHCMSSWVNWATYEYEHGKLDQARDSLNRSLKSLAPRKHLALLTKFGQLEFKLGDAERGRTIFENILANHPKRSDLWFVFADMELKYGKDEERTRQVYERMISLDLNPVKMKPIFKRYLTFEATHGTPETVNHVKTKASEYIALKSKE